MKKYYFSQLLPELATRASRATLSRLGFSSSELRAYLERYFSASYGRKGCFVGEPIFEATFGWEESEHSLEALSPQLLSADLVNALDRPGGDPKSDFRFPRHAKPYRHQLESWQILAKSQPQSVVVTSGTGSGKTECFMVPILDQLARSYADRGSKLIGVEALFLYPLNALIQSQRDRLNAWTKSFDDGVRYCLYNGLTPQNLPQWQRDQHRNEVADRETLRAAPPPLLVTNATMLEYMLVRAQDAPILEQSQGSLKWIVLDEAHTYVGSQAAELALLLRRVLHAFGVTSDQVRFVATSATIGASEAEEQLREFLARVAGLSLDQVHVVSGTRLVPDLTEGDETFAGATLDVLEPLAENPEVLYQALSANRFARSIRQEFTPPSDRIVPLSTLARRLANGAAPSVEDSAEALKWLDLLTTAQSRSKGQTTKSFLPLRAHLFHNVLDGLWACANPDCHCKAGTELDSPNWSFGLVYSEPRKHCECGSPVYEMRSCNECNTTFLWARRFGPTDDGKWRLLQTTEDEVDEFSLDTETAEEDDAVQVRPQYTPVLIANGHKAATAEILVDPGTLTFDPIDAEGALKLRARDESVVDDDGTIAMVCPECGSDHGASGGALFRKAMLGAPFMLGEIVPTLLEFCPDIDADEAKPLERPYRGRRMITFTDSRQGTARIAARLQQDSERNRVRGLVFKKVLTSGASGGDADAQKLKDEIDGLRLALEKASIPAIQAMLDDKQKELNAMSGYRPVLFADMVQWLSAASSDVKDWMHGYYKDQDPDEFDTNNGRERLARILLTREFGRRPKRVNSLETMGLVKTVYPKLETINRLPAFAGDVPAIALSDWKDFLKIALDFHIRENTFIELPDAWLKWGGNRVSAKQLMPPDTKQAQTNRYKRWPQCQVSRRQSRLVRILVHGLKIDAQQDSGRTKLDAILRGAWDQLLSLGLLEMGDTGRYLKLDSRDSVALEPMTKGWLCPVTRRVLDTTFKGITPYLPPQAVSDKVTLCTPLEMPDYSPIATLDQIGDERVEIIRQWLNSDERVANLRRKGLWSDLNDRVVEGSFYFRAAEHSAQQPGKRLGEYESLFKSGRINLLSCSTTMEMGVDIGGISVVAMNNVPPHPANYLQRAGRAGRRSETRSVSLSLCKSNPHDQQVFSNPLWPFETVLPAPNVLLSSSIIVQRHLNSMLLAHFLRKELRGSGSAEKLNLDWWMLSENESRQQRFSAWTACFSSTSEPLLAKGLKSLLRHTPHEGTASLDRLVAEAGRMANAHANRWFAEFDVVEAELARFTNPEDIQQPSYKALKIQRARLVGEYLLRELATEGFLPGYGFPTDIAPLDTLTVDELARLDAHQRRRQPQDGQGRIDNRMRFRDLPSRDMVTALREYAPGSEVVIDGSVYRSAGITLNWHAPASLTAVNEIQSIRDAWRCRRCGSSGTHVRANRVTACPDCGAALGADREVRFDYIEPAGFAVDLYSNPHNDVSTQTYVPVSLPWINATGEWLSLPNPELGVHRSSVDGIVFHHSAGLHGHGFAVCLCCGRAEPMTAEDLLPDEFFDNKKGQLKEHKRLRGAQGGATRVCEGSYNGYSIQRGMRLGHEAKTDVMELVLKGLNDQPIRDRKTAFTIAVAIRNAVASMLGIDTSELGCDTKPVHFRNDGVCHAIVLFDRNASGYVSSVADRLPKILRAATRELNCNENCEAACQHCLMDFDTRFRLEELDRHAGRLFLSDEWLTHLQLPTEYAYFGLESAAEHQAFVEAISREIAAPSAELLRIFLAGDPDDWDIGVSPVRRWIARWAATCVPVEIVVDQRAVASLSRENKSVLAAMTLLDSVTVRSGAPATTPGGSAVMAEISQGSRVIAWAGRTEFAVPGVNWGDCGGTMIVRGPAKAANVGDLLEFKVSEPDGLPAQTVRIEILDELDGAAFGFGRRLIECIQNNLGSSLFAEGDTIVGIKYHDRYLNSPLPAALLLEFVSALRNAAIEADAWGVGNTELCVSPMPTPRDHQLAPTKIWQNWESEQSRTEALVSAFEYAGLELSLTTLTKADTIHARRMDISFSSGRKLQLWLDQGFSYWQIPRDRSMAVGRTYFPFSGGAEQQAESIGNADFRIEGQVYPTYAFLGWS